MSAPEPAWDPRVCDALIDELWPLRQAMLDAQRALAPWLQAVAPAHRASATNLVHYLALRQVDLRAVQERLSRLGLSSLGRSETHALANLDKVLGILHRLAGRPWETLAGDEPVGSRTGPALLERNASALLGPPPAERRVRIMVTLPSEAAHDAVGVDSLVRAGMDIARINCAHDDADAWLRMARHVRQAAQALGRPVQVLMDLGGPKLRTGAVLNPQAVLKVKAARNVAGHKVAPACIWLQAADAPVQAAAAGVVLGVNAHWLDCLQDGDAVELLEAGGKARKLRVGHREAHGVLLESARKLVFTEASRLRRTGTDGEEADTGVFGIPLARGQLHLQPGQRLHLLDAGLGMDAVPAAAGRRARPAQIACTLPEALKHLRAGDRVWFDDGRIGAIVRRRLRRGAVLEITQARQGGERLAADKGINLPDTRLDLPALTHKDIQDLASVARHADLVGLSFAQSAADVQALQQHLRDLQAAHLGLIVKIETRRGFEHLPEILLAAMAGPRAGVMIARGDLAVECGYERLAEVQEEMLWACEAAHLPVVWATQVLENLAKTGLPSRAEITDAAMGERAECVMLNKGAHIVDAMHTLDDILRRMQAHQSKKRPLLRALKSWNLGAPAQDLAQARTTATEAVAPASRRAGTHATAGPTGQQGA